MMKNVYITKLATFLPNAPVKGEQIEDFLGLVNEKPSRSRAIVLRNNGIKKRYYAIDKEGNSTHNNAELTAEAIKKLFPDSKIPKDVKLLACGTTSPDLLLPSHASMVHGIIGAQPMETLSPAGSCNSGMIGLNYAFMSILTGNHSKAICTGSEKISTWLFSKFFEENEEEAERLNKEPFLAFNKEFLRWMLSDGASAIYLEDKPEEKGVNLKIEWIDISSYAHETATCMFAGGQKNEDGKITAWRDLVGKESFSYNDMLLSQDTRLLEKNITQQGAKALKESAEKHQLDINSIDYFLPHMSSEFFRKKINDELQALQMNIAPEKWFTNLDHVGNVGSASAFLMLEELVRTKSLKKGMKILLMVPESARFSYTYALLTVY